MQTQTRGHLLAFFTIFIWGTTYISSKVLLQTFTPTAILFLRFVMAYVLLWILYPHLFHPQTRKQELLFASAGLCGIMLYYLLENIALTYTFASNVGIIISAAPFFTAILAHFFLEGEPLRPQFFCGFAAAMLGIILISYTGTSTFAINPLGDLLALAAALVWAVYSILTRKLSAYQYPTIAVTRRTFFYGILCMLPVVGITGLHLDPAAFLSLQTIGNFLFLGLIASAICFVTWNEAVHCIGAVKSSIYIYLSPVVTVVTSMLVLHERLTPLSACGTLLTLAGLLLSQGNFRRRKFAQQGETANHEL